MMDPATFFSFAKQLGDAARAAALAHFRTPLHVDNKEARGFDPVTRADRETETVLRELISTRFPDHGIRGEEFPDHRTDSEYCWILDPIDGTRAYISGLPVWGVLVGLLRDGQPVFGMMDQPFTGERFLGGQGRAEWRQGTEMRVLRVSDCQELGTASLCTTDPYLFVGAEKTAFDDLRARTRLQRYGLDCYAYCMLAAGHVDLVVESGLQDFDIAPLIPIIEAAGGVIANWQGESAAKGGQVVAAATPELLQQALEILAPAAA